MHPRAIRQYRKPKKVRGLLTPVLWGTEQTNKSARGRNPPLGRGQHCLTGKMAGVAHLVDDPDGQQRCWWGVEPDIYRSYHDHEWGRAVADDHRLFEKLCLEGFQAGLSWLTILRKRDNFREAFDNFDPAAVAGYGEAEIDLLLANSGIIRHRAKIVSTINNARRALELTADYGSLTAFFWGEYGQPSTPASIEIQSTTEASRRLAKDLKKRGFTFVGPTTVYAFMQAMGLVNDHLEGCLARAGCEQERQLLLERFGS
jgi:DNA-3-methyladenine glycosylase I